MAAMAVCRPFLSSQLGSGKVWLHLEWKSFSRAAGVAAHLMFAGLDHAPSILSRTRCIQNEATQRSTLAAHASWCR